METKTTDIQLQVMICTYGTDGIRRVASATHPRVAGVEYLVSWQTDGNCPLPKKLDRSDFSILTTSTRGLSVNRNFVLSKASAPILLFSDDDVDYTEDGLQGVVKAFHDNPEADLITFRYDSNEHTKHYPDVSYNISARKKGHFISSIEIAVRRNSVQGHVWFNENFGIGGTFPAGEEDIFLHDCIKAGLKCLYIPFTIAHHEGSTTSDRNLMLPSRPQTKGAIILRLHPLQWPLRMLVHALREVNPWRMELVPSPISYCRNWLKGVRMALRMNVFPTPDYSTKYSKHE